MFSLIYKKMYFSHSRGAERNVGVKIYKSPGREGYIGLFITLVPKVLHIITLSYSLTYQLWELYQILIAWFIKLSVQTFQPQIVIYSRGNFVYHHWGCKSIYRLLFYPLRSLTKAPSASLLNKYIFLRLTL